MNNAERKDSPQDKMETPYYLIDQQELENNVSDLKSALESNWSNYQIGYSFKTNALPWLLQYFKKQGIYAEVVSDDEYQLAQEIGYEKDRVIYNGPAKSKQTFLEAIINGCIINIDSLRELEWLKELNDQDRVFSVGVRINFDLEHYCPGESAMGSEGGRFGFCYENGELKKAFDAIFAMKNIILDGIHLHCSTKTRSLNVYRAIARIACEIKREYGLRLKYVDVGGGFFGGLKGKPSFSDYMIVISEELGKAFSAEETTLIVEPGTSLVSSPFSLITSIIDVKRTTINHFVVTDGSRDDVDPLRHKSNYFHTIESRSESDKEIVRKQVICGFTCMEGDRLFTLEDHCQLQVGDRIIFEKIGAYTMCLSPLFIKYFPAVYLKLENEIICVREKWSATDFIRRSVLDV